MRFKLFVPLMLTASLLLAVVPAYSQVIAPYQQGRNLPLAIGFGPSGFEPDWGHGRMYGGAAWADYFPNFLPPRLDGLGIEVEVRDISLDKHLEPNQGPRSGQANTKEDTAGGGVIYHLHSFRNLRPYAKFIVSDGSVDFISDSLTYSHDTRGVYAPGGGIEYRVYKQMWARLDYEYQMWEGKLLGNILTPQGFTAGFTYDWSHPAQP